MFAFILMLFIFMFAKRDKPKINISYLVLIFVMLNVNISKIYPSTILYQNSVNDTQKLREQREIPKAVLEKLDSETDLVYVLSQNDRGYKFWVTHFNLTPVKSLPEEGFASWSLGKKYNNDDIWTKNFSVDKFSEYLQEFTHLYIDNADKQFIDGYGSVFANPSDIKDKTLFRVENQNGATKLVKA